MNMMGEFVDGCVEQSSVGLKIPVMDDYLFLIRMIQSVYLAALLTREYKREILYRSIQLQKEFFHLILIHSH